MSAECAIRVMLVDDEPDVRFLAATILAGAEGVEVVAEASRGEEALELLAAADPHVVVLDSRMPGLSGLQTAAELRRRRPGQALVLCSANADPAVWEEARRAGVGACVSKEDLFSLPDVVRGLVGTTA